MPLQGEACTVVHAIAPGHGAVEVTVVRPSATGRPTSTARRTGTHVEVGVCGAGTAIDVRAATGRDAQRAFVLLGTAP